MIDINKVKNVITDNMTKVGIKYKIENDTITIYETGNKREDKVNKIELFTFLTEQPFIAITNLTGDNNEVIWNVKLIDNNIITIIWMRKEKLYDIQYQ
jgi:hypothetical protein